jgi:hypothetical protein
MSEASKMPARIYAFAVTPDYGSWAAELGACDGRYVHADIAEQMAEALTWALAELDKRTTYQHPGQFLACDTRARAALTAWEASNG